MKKMKLNPEQLTVDSFDTSAAPERGGTVFGEQDTAPTDCTCPGVRTCKESCDGICYESFNGTCVGGQATCGATCDSCEATRCLETCYGHGC